MKRQLLTFSIIVFIVSSIYSENKNITLTYEKKYTSSKGTTISRAPMHMPIDISYDSNTSCIEISCQQAVEAEVYLYDMHNNILDYSPTLNTTFIVPVSYNSTLYIHIENEDWYAIGEIEI